MTASVTMLTTIRGSGAGALATVAMSVPILLARRSGLIDREPPHEITDTLTSRAGLSLGGSELDVASTLAHLGFGATAGAVFAVATRRVGGRRRRIGLGVLYGVGIWALAYPGILPRLGLVRTARQAGPARDLVMLAAHLVFGAILGSTVRRD